MRGMNIYISEVSAYALISDLVFFASSVMPVGVTVCIKWKSKLSLNEFLKLSVITVFFKKRAPKGKKEYCYPFLFLLKINYLLRLF